MKNWLKPLLEWIILIALGVGAGLGLAWLPLEKSVKDIGILVIGSAFLIWTVYVATIAYRTMWSNVNDWDSDWNNDETSAKLEVKS
jgi:hypothetical protein